MTSDQEQFARVFADLSPRVFLYARRHCDAATAQDVVADTFLVAWRRWSEVPANPLPWLLVVARNTLASRFRYEVRQGRLVDAVAQLERVTGPVHGADHDVMERATLLAALAELSEVEREALLLIGWDGCTAREAAEIAGCTVRAFEVRLSRARARLTRAAGRSADQPDEPDPARCASAAVAGPLTNRMAR